MNATANEIRIDKWLWAVRLYKTRSLAIAACRAGHVKSNGQNVKPAHSVRIGEVIAAQTGHITRTVRVVALVQNRVSAKAVSQYLEDLTPASEYEKPREASFQPMFLRARGTGRPTKKDRRLLDGLLP